MQLISGGLDRERIQPCSAQGVKCADVGRSHDCVIAKALSYHVPPPWVAMAYSTVGEEAHPTIVWQDAQYVLQCPTHCGADLGGRRFGPGLVLYLHGGQPLDEKAFAAGDSRGRGAAAVRPAWQGQPIVLPYRLQFSDFTAKSASRDFYSYSTSRFKAASVQPHCHHIRNGAPF